MDNEILKNKRIEFGKTKLGPLLYEFCDKLDAYFESIGEKDNIVLFEARDGLRIKYLYDLYRKKRNLRERKNHKEFYISRIAAVSGCLNSDFDFVSSIISHEFKNMSVKELIKAFLKKDYFIPEEKRLVKIDSSVFNEIYNSDETYGKELREFFNLQNKYLEEYIRNLSKNKKNIILVDTGWFAHTQAILMRRFSNKKWTGLYFGKWDYKDINPNHFNEIEGLCLNDNKFTSKTKRVYLYFYHHLIEEPLESRIPSTEYYIKKNNKIIPAVEINHEQIAPQKINDDFFKGIVEYFNDYSSDSSYDIHKRAENIYKYLSKKIIFPSKKDIEIMSVYRRSPDFGKDYFVEPVIKYDRGKGFNQKRIKISNSLWRQGQIRYEYPVIAPLVLIAFYIYTRNKGKIVWI